MLCLIKPQFEAGKENVGKKGVVRDKAVHVEVVEKTIAMILDNNMSVLGLTFSPVKGPEGNIEYLVYIQRTESPEDVSGVTAKEIVEKSHLELDK